MGSSWIEYGSEPLEEGSYYEISYWKRRIVWGDGSVDEGRFIHQGIVKYEDGFKEDGYWIKPSPTHVRKIDLTFPDGSTVNQVK